MLCGCMTRRREAAEGLERWVEQAEERPVRGRKAKPCRESLPKKDRSLLETRNGGGLRKIVLAKSPPQAKTSTFPPVRKASNSTQYSCSLNLSAYTRFQN